MKTGFYKKTAVAGANYINACGAAAAGYHTGSTAATAVADCSECTFDTTKGSLAVVCTACGNSKFLQQIYSETNTTFLTLTARNCVASSVTGYPVRSSVYNENGRTTGGAFISVVECVDPHFYTAGATASDAATCADASALTGCKYTKKSATDTRTGASTAAANKCGACNDGYALKADLSACQQKPDNCKTVGAYNTATGATKALCTECGDTSNTSHIYIAKSDNSACFRCDPSSANTANCAKYKAGTAACECDTCLPGYYLDAATPKKCINTKITNCLFMDPIKTDKSCFACKIGYFWDATATTPACTLCSTEKPCATTGCEALDYPGKPKPSTAGGAAAANTGIICFIATLFAIIMTFLI